MEMKVDRKEVDLTWVTEYIFEKSWFICPLRHGLQ